MCRLLLTRHALQPKPIFTKPCIQLRSDYTDGKHGRRIKLCAIFFWTTLCTGGDCFVLFLPTAAH